MARTEDCAKEEVRDEEPSGERQAWPRWQHNQRGGPGWRGKLGLGGVMTRGNWGGGDGRELG